MSAAFSQRCGDAVGCSAARGAARTGAVDVGPTVMMRLSDSLTTVYLCRDAVNFRKGINGLAVLVEHKAIEGGNSSRDQGPII